ncbi:AsnC family transcriptional regulator [Microvirga thermotolerans]|uniref:AsnC family transcriptional regulator n=1 Tax=Microvirga thermotolerans TaxID=2651334 RepID=A0A5P9JU99_9HYPH|nr:Lrp/AsnC family transcriptional regulator [Microvirga thermotolerans]QFU15030.1 AsnC family transcriptional regulator [Microvirga thermotolerans]
MAQLVRKLRNEGHALDGIDRRLIEALAANARQSLADLGRAVGLSAPSVAERLRRLEDSGLVNGYTLDLDPRALGYGLTAIVRIKPLPGQLHMVEKLLTESPEVVECDKVTGEDCYIARFVLRSIDELDPVLDRIAQRAQTSTSIVKSSPVRRRLPPLPAD